MTSGADRPRLRLFRDGRFVEDEPPGAPAAVPAAAPSPSRLGRVLGCGCLAVVVVPLLVVTLVAGLFALASGSAEEQAATTGVVLSVGPGTDADGVRRDHCYEVAYEAGGEDLVHRTCEVVPRAAADEPGTATPAQRDARFAASHPVGSKVRLRHAAEPPYAGRGAIADLAVTLVPSGSSSALRGALVAATSAAVAVLALWLGLRGLRRAKGSD